MSDVAMFSRRPLSRAQRLNDLYEKIKAIRAELAPAARTYFDQEIDRWEQGGAPPHLLAGMAALWEPDYLVQPVPIREFIFNPHFLGSAFKPLRTTQRAPGEHGNVTHRLAPVDDALEHFHSCCIPYPQ